MTKKELQIKINQKVWVTPGHYDNKTEPYEAVVTKVGNKYFELNNNAREKFDNKTLKQSNGINYNTQVYISLQQIQDKKEHKQLSNFIRTKFGSYGNIPFSLDKLRQIAEILEIKP